MNSDVVTPIAIKFKFRRQTRDTATVATLNRLFSLILTFTMEEEEGKFGKKISIETKIILIDELNKLQKATKR